MSWLKEKIEMKKRIRKKKSKKSVTHTDIINDENERKKNYK